ncbi:MAG: pre-peptidase C-terminal domain-containing protein [Tepidisphaerales bacterium]
MYSFQATTGQNYSVQINTTTLADGGVSIVDQDGVSQLDWAEAVGANSSDSVVWQAPADGTYYLQVSSGDGQSTGTYSVSATPTSLSASNPDGSTDGSGNPVFVYGPSGGGPIGLFFNGGRFFANAGAAMGFDAPSASGFSATAAGNAPVPAAVPPASDGSVVTASTAPVQPGSGVATDLASAKAAPDVFASQSAPIGSGDLLHKPDNLLGSNDALL